MSFQIRYRFIRRLRSSVVISHYRFVTGITALIAISLTAFAAAPVHAAIVSGSAVQQEVRPNDVIEVLFFLDTEGQDANAIEGTVVVPEALEVRDVRDGNTDVTLWIERPAPAESGGIRFSGIIPGGRTDSNLFLFTLVLRAGDSGQGSLDARDLRVLLNDGRGTEAPSSFRPLELFVREDAPPAPELPPAARDREPPESFEPLLVQDPAIAGGKHVLLFVTQDKGTGIARYEVFETRRALTSEEDVRWVEAKSPYVLEDQKLKSFIYVKATDREGNERIARLEPAHELLWYEKEEYLVILVMTICIAGVEVFVLFRRKSWRGWKT